MSKLRDLQTQAVSDLATQTAANAAKLNADAAVAKSTPVFAAAIKAEPGNFTIDVKADPPVLYASTDGVTFSTAPITSLDDPDPTPATGS